MENNTTDYEDFMVLFNTMRDQSLWCLIMVLILLLYKIKKSVTSVVTSTVTYLKSNRNSRETTPKLYGV